MIEIDLKGRAILITGALGAIAEAVAKRLSEAGAFLVLTDILPEGEAQERVTKWNLAAGSWHYALMDVTDPQNVSVAIQSIFETFPHTDAAIGLAGGCPMHPFGSTPQEEFDRIHRYNFLGQTYFTRSVLNEWVRRHTSGQIIYTSSLVGSLPWPDLSAYTSAKAAVEMFAKCLALEYSEHHIRFNVVAPGHVATGSQLKIYNEDEPYRTMVNRVIPLKRMVRPEAIANAFLWLCSPLGDDINGQVIKVDLGASIPKVG
jgi:NAD(P)-dependent dehydrogenase (short-subunit alcohol dehydrogenase family)